MNAPVYMDYNASAPLKASALAAMSDVQSHTGNPASVHQFGRSMRRRLNEAREAIASLVGAVREEVIFTSGGSEANNLALASRGQRRLLVSSIEHDSVLVPAMRAGATQIAVDASGRVDLDHLALTLAADRCATMISVMWANNETGVVQPVAEVATIAARAGALFHCDATQAAGRVPLAMDEIGIDMLTISAHKIGGPQGVGALVTRSGISISPQILGGGQERFRRAGTENAAGIAGFGAAASEARELSSMAGIAALRDRMELTLRAIAPGLRFFGAEVERLANTSCFALAGKSAETLVMALDLAGFAISAGSACSSGKMRPSHVIQAMGHDGDLARAAVRVSLGPENDGGEIDAFVAAFAAAIGRTGLSRNAA